VPDQRLKIHPLLFEHLDVVNDALLQGLRPHDRFALSRLLGRMLAETRDDVASKGLCLQAPDIFQACITDEGPGREEIGQEQLELAPAEDARHISDSQKRHRHLLPAKARS
jgi:hypothetical protein